MSNMKITAIVPWFGAKRTLAPEIARELGPHRSYFEPFCGSMAVLLAKPESSHENVNDLHGDLINLARVIQHDTLGPMFYRRMRRVWLHEETFKGCRARLIAQPMPDEIDFDRACDFFLVSWFGRNGVVGTRSYNYGFCARWTPNGGHGGRRFSQAVNSIPHWRRRMRRLTILRRDAFEFIASIEDCDGTAIYCDPPYLVKGAMYVHDFTEEQHLRLAEELRRFRKARVVVSYYDDERLHDLYPGWGYRVIEVAKALAHQGARGVNNTKAREVLLTNGPSYGQDEGTLF